MPLDEKQEKILLYGGLALVALILYRKFAAGSGGGGGVLGGGGGQGANPASGLLGLAQQSEADQTKLAISEQQIQAELAKVGLARDLGIANIQGNLAIQQSRSNAQTTQVAITTGGSLLSKVIPFLFGETTTDAPDFAPSYGASQQIPTGSYFGPYSGWSQVSTAQATDEGIVSIPGGPASMPADYVDTSYTPSVWT